MQNHNLEIKDLLIDILESDQTDIQSIEADENLVESGLTSLKAISLVILIEEKFNIVLEDEDLLFENINSISKINIIINKYLVNT
ncbi:acyl carrier protein [Paenibacillus agilis]|uniref:Acyl carrier protein n=1 Tax=Paenibacillus agilis TaxID=3020863 RepID=A0A559J123_9BACL|nr:acyl carrier protein [Paenibacillus agilis]TVX93577.1 acyl carrier protein [Paenibacillus agilis]